MAWPFRPISECIERVDIPRKVQAKNFLDHGRVPIVSQEAGLINGYWDDERDAVRVASPVVIFGDHTQVLKLVDFDFVVGADGVKVLKPKPFLNASFLKYFLEANPVPSLGYARHFRHVSGSSIPLPPLDAQKRIIAKLDQAFAALDRARANAEANLADAQEVYAAQLQALFAEGGEAKELGSLCDVFADGDWIETKDQSSDGVRLIQTGNIGRGVFKDRAEKARYISEETFKRLKCTEIFEGDCLISRLPDPVGRGCILQSTGRRMITAVDCTIVRFDENQMLSTFFNHYAQSARYFEIVSKKCTGTTRNRISRSNLALVPVPVPPIPEQRAIVATLDKMRDEVLTLREFYTQKLNDLSVLRQSLLQAAFSGQLT